MSEFQSLVEGVIRKLIVYRPSGKEMVYIVGQDFSQLGRIASIIFDKPHFTIYGKYRYNIFIMRERKAILWKSEEGQPCSVEYDIKNEVVEI